MDPPDNEYVHIEHYNELYCVFINEYKPGKYHPIFDLIGKVHNTINRNPSQTFYVILEGMLIDGKQVYFPKSYHRLNDFPYPDLLDETVIMLSEQFIDNNKYSFIFNETGNIGDTLGPIKNIYPNLVMFDSFFIKAIYKDINKSH